MKKQPRATYTKVQLPPASATPSSPPTPSTTPPTVEEDTPHAIAEELIPLDHLEDPDFETADLYIWHHLFREALTGNVQAMRVWIQSRTERTVTPRIHDHGDISDERLAQFLLNAREIKRQEEALGRMPLDQLKALDREEAAMYETDE